MAPGVMVAVSKSEKVLWVHGGKTENNFICEDQIMPQASYKMFVNQMNLFTEA